LPFDEAIIDELEEDGYEESVKYLKELFDLDKKNEIDPQMLLSKKTCLRENRDMLLRLKEGLIAFERAKAASTREKLRKRL